MIQFYKFTDDYMKIAREKHPDMIAERVGDLILKGIPSEVIDFVTATDPFWALNDVSIILIRGDKYYACTIHLTYLKNLLSSSTKISREEFEEETELSGEVLHTLIPGDNNVKAGVDEQESG